jgi:hypothetical protein
MINKMILQEVRIQQIGRIPKVQAGVSMQCITLLGVPGAKKNVAAGEEKSFENPDLSGFWRS